MWNSKRSLTLSKVFVIIFMVAIIVVFCTTPEIISNSYGFIRNAEPMHVPLFLCTIYSGGLVALVLLLNSYKLLVNISKGKIFIDDNVKYFRQISWCCFIGALISLISAFYYLPWVFITIAAAFVCVIVRVIKNVFQEAIIIKNENDYTI